ncbi:MAG: hypothetical protein U9N85_13090 [Bacteroidota bacterium]|nr:hypothetical protein [Bacteroidota bacterium]
MKFKNYTLIFFVFISLGVGKVMGQDKDSTHVASDTSEVSDLQKFNEKNWKSYETEEERNTFYKDWKKKDSAELEKKTELKPKHRRVLSKIYKDLSFADKIRYKWGEKKLQRKYKRLYRQDKNRFKKTIRWSRPDKNYSKSEMKGLEKEQKIKYLKLKNSWDSRKEAYRKQKIMHRFDKKEKRLRKRYALSQHEKIVLNKALGRSLDAEEKSTYRRARRKQIVFTRKLTKLRKRRHYRLQNKQTKKRLNKKPSKLRDRDYFVKKNRKFREEQNSN